MRESIETGKFNTSILQTLYWGYKPFIGQIVFLLFIGFAGRILLLANTNVIGYWVEHRDLHVLTVMAAMCSAGLIFGLWFRVVFSRLSARAVSQIYDEVTYRTSRYPIQYFDHNPVGRIVTRFSSDYGNVFRMFGGPLAEFISIMFDLAGQIILITLASPVYLLVVLLIFIFNYSVYRANRQRLRQERRALSASRSPSIAHFSETTQGASTIRSFDKQQNFKKRFVSLDGLYLKQRMSTINRIILFSSQMNFLMGLIFLLTGLISYWGLVHFNFSASQVGVAFTFIILSSNSIQMFFDWFAQFEEAMVSLERLDQYLRNPIEEGSKLPSDSMFETGHSKRQPTQSDSKSELQGNRDEGQSNKPSCLDVKIQDVWLKYAETSAYVLKGISLDIKAGERVGIIGRTGSGKSSLIQTLYGLYKIEKGNIQIGGKRAIYDIDLQEYRTLISYISQDPVLFQGTLRDNLDISGSLADQKLEEVIARVGLRLKLNLRIEEKGKNLSAGERQLICMARCLLQQAPIVVMDEATSQVDPVTEELIQNASEQILKGKTQIIVAHRFSTLETCDRIFWLDQGTIKAVGTPGEILKTAFVDTSTSLL